MSAPRNDAPTVVPRPRRRLWDGALPESLGLGFVALIFGGLAVGYVITDRTWRQQSSRAHVAEAETLAQGLAGAFGALGDADPSRLDELVGHAARSARLRSVRWLDPQGAVRAAWPPVASPPDTTAAETEVAVPVRAPTGQPAGELHVALGPPPDTEHRTTLLWTWGLATAVTLVVFIALYRRLRGYLRPLAAIQHNLQEYADGLAQELRTLALSDALGPTAQGWNRLIAELSDLQRQVVGAAGGQQANVLARFESAVFRRVVDRLPFGVLCVNRTQGIEYANVAAAALLQRTGEELQGQAVSAVIDNGAVAQAVTAAQARSGPGRTVDHTTQTGEQETTLRFHVQPLSAEAGAGDVLLVVEDVSQLREGERARDNFLYHVTHELRTPLTNIHAYTETLTQPGFDDEQTRKECYNVIISETKRLSALVENILSVSQLEVGTARLDVGDVDLARLMRQMVQDNLGAADEKRIDLTLHLPPKVPKLQGDKQRLAVLLNNLIGNAIKYTPAGGQVQVHVEADAGTLRIAVQDNGIGIAPEDQAHVFEKFYRAADDAVQSITGTGLGLALAREVARLHGGDIVLTSERGQGSTFTIELPLPADEHAEVAKR